LPTSDGYSWDISTTLWLSAAAVLKEDIAMDTDDEKKAEIENVRTEYREVCANHRAITDFRGKLLTLLPLVSGAGIYVLIPKQSDPHALDPKYLIAIGVFGFLVTLGLFLHELRGIQECGQLIGVGRSLEETMGLPEGQFVQEDNYYHKQSGLTCFVNNFKGPVGAAWIIYPSVSLAWLFVAILGLR
jgi:hypothetical protein